MRRPLALLGGILAASLASPSPAEEAATAPPSFRFAKPVRLKADGGFVDVGRSGGFANPACGDVDGDGKRDLVVGDFSGRFRVFRNVGTDAKPDYKPSGPLQAGGADASAPVS